MTSPAQHSPEAQAEAFIKWEIAKEEHEYLKREANRASCAEANAKTALIRQIVPGLTPGSDPDPGVYITWIDGRAVQVTSRRDDIGVIRTAVTITADARQPEGAS